MSDLLHDKEFLDLEKKYPLLSRYRSIHELESLPYVILDIETTGLYPDKSEIIEIGAIKTEGAAAKDIFSSLIKPVSAIPELITNLTGITDDLVAGSPPAKDILSKFLDFIDGHVLIAHNTDFDINFLKYHIDKELGKPMDNKVLCTVRVSRGVVPGLANYKLHTVAGHFNIPIPNRHRAMGDCEITFNVWTKLLEIMKQKGIDSFSAAEKFMTV